MKLVKCGKCGAQFDVAAMRPGSTFACGKCRGAVSVPAEASPATVALSPDQMKKALDEARAAAAPAAPGSTPRSVPKLPPAMQARAQATSASAPTRAAGAAPAPAASAAPQPAAASSVAVKSAAAPRAARTRAPAAAPEKKSQVMTYAIIGGVVVAGIAAAVVFSGGDKPKETAVAPKPAEAPKPVLPPAPPPKQKDPSNFDDFLSMSVKEQHDALIARFVAAGSDKAQLLQLYEWVTNPKVADLADAKATAKRIVETALASDTDCEWARTANGDRRIRELLEKCKDECGIAFTMPDPPEKALVERLGTIDAKPWVDAAEWKKYEDFVAQIRARAEKMKLDPHYLEAEQLRDWVRLGQEFRNVEMTWHYSDPYVIFQEIKKQDVRTTKRTGRRDEDGREIEEPVDGTVDPRKVSENEGWAAKAKLFATRDGIIFNELNHRFRELFADEFKLEPLETCGPDKKGRRLVGLVMWNRKSFDKLLEETGQTISPGIRAFYSPAQQKIFHYIGDEALRSLDEIPVDGGWMQKESDQVTFHEGTHQLQHEYTAILSGRPLKRDEIRVGSGRRAMWFEEGIAEFMGAAECEAAKVEFLDGVKWRHNRVLLGRVAESRANRTNVEKWTIKEFLKATSNEDLHTTGEKLAPGHGDSMASHFYCRGWGFCHFLWNYDNGKYRPKFMHFLRDVFNGSWSIDKFAKDMGRPSAADWGPVEKEFAWYWKQLLLRDVRKLPTGWRKFDSDTPTGKVEDDPDFVWDPNQKDGGDDK